MRKRLFHKIYSGKKKRSEEDDEKSNTEGDVDEHSGINESGCSSDKERSVFNEYFKEFEDESTENVDVLESFCGINFN